MSIVRNTEKGVEQSGQAHFNAPTPHSEGTEKVDNTACVCYNAYIKYRRCFYDRTTAEIGVKSIHGNI